MLLKVLLYGYCTGTTSSRRLEQGCAEIVPLRFLAANQQPDHHTFARFRRRHANALQVLFVDVLLLCRRAGLAKLGTVALDGTKVAANASMSANRDKAHIEVEIAKLFAAAEQADSQDESTAQQRKESGDLPKDLRTSPSRLARLQAALQELREEEVRENQVQEERLVEREERENTTGKKLPGRKPGKSAKQEKPKRRNITDLDSRLMKDSRGFLQGYNAQAMADEEHQIIVACDVTTQENDKQQLLPMLAQCQRQAGQLPDRLLADAGYPSQSNLSNAPAGVDLYIAMNSQHGEATKDIGISTAGRIPAGASLTQRMARKVKTRRGKALYAKRKTIIEPVFGQLDTRGLRRFWLRGLALVKTEWALWCLTHNLLKFWRAGGIRAIA